jgi:DNA-binding response OmpR family regulator
MDRLLLVEHRSLFGESLALLLEWRTGLSCDQAGSLAEARTILEGTPRNLPEGEGAEVLEGLDRVPILALIEGRNVRRQAEAIGLGADEVLGTSGPVEKLVAAVERLIA